MNGDYHLKIRTLRTSIFKIASLQAKSTDERIRKLIEVMTDIHFSVKVRQSNSNQLESNIDEKIIEAIRKDYSVTNDNSSLNVVVGADSIGKLDCRFSDNINTNYYMEIEKSNKKTMWFDYIKLLTCLSGDADGIGILMCPTNYAHKLGVWNLYDDAVVYGNHLKRVFNSPGLNRIAVIGYTQYVKAEHGWKEFDRKVVELKRSR